MALATWPQGGKKYTKKKKKNKKDSVNSLLHSWQDTLIASAVVLPRHLDNDNNNNDNGDFNIKRNTTTCHNSHSSITFNKINTFTSYSVVRYGKMHFFYLLQYYCHKRQKST